MAWMRSRNRRHTEDRRAGRLWRKGRHRAEHIASQLQDETIPALTHDLQERIDTIRDEATPIVESVSERLPGRRRSRKARGFRMILFLGAIAAVAVIVYLARQRRDEEPAYLVQEPDRPMNPGQQGPGGGPGGTTSNPNGQGGDAIGSAYRYEAQSTRSN